ncbi:MAG TPA: hypothetical protein EYO85_01040, partial [Rhodospirillales bacterium]|nr:hypothetical protein [Rhodospirillales bacterium]
RRQGDVRARGFIQVIEDHLAVEQHLVINQAEAVALEDLRLIMEPMASTGAEPIGSMGNDTPLAVLSPGTTGVMIGFPNWPETPIRPILSFLFAPGEA